MKELSFATLQFSQDYGAIAAAPEYLEEALCPISKTNRRFSSPTAPSVTASTPICRGALIDVNNGVRLPAPANIVAEMEKVIPFYEGRDEKLNFRYDGRAAVSFAAGRVALVTPDEAKDLRWLP